MSHASAGFGEPVDLVAGHEDRVGEPHIVAQPADGFGEVDRTLAVDFEAVFFLKKLLGEMRVEVHALVAARQRRRVAHQFRRHREG
jgi:hypothetical protein